MKIKRSFTLPKILSFLLVLPLLPAHSGTVTINGSGSAGTGAIFVTTALGNIDLGTRVRIGAFTDLTVLNNTINSFTLGTSNYADTLLALNSNFVDLGTNVANYGNTSQSAVGGAIGLFTPSSNQFRFNNISSLTINGVSQDRVVFNGSIPNVNYSAAAGIGASKSLYMWVAFNDQLGIVRNADGSGTSAWTTPTSDLNGITMNLTGINSQSEVLLGTYVDNVTGVDFVALVPEPSSASLVVFGFGLMLAKRRMKKTKIHA